MQSEPLLGDQLRTEIGHLAAPVGIDAVPAKQLFGKGARGRLGGLELSDDFATADDSEGLVSVLDRVKEISEAP